MLVTMKALLDRANEENYAVMAPNVFYELGIRHALADNVTVLIKRVGAPIPFNIQGLAVIEYDLSEDTLREEAKKKIADYIRKSQVNGQVAEGVDPEVYILHVVTLTVSSIAALPVVGGALHGTKEEISDRHKRELSRIARTSLFAR